MPKRFPSPSSSSQSVTPPPQILVEKKTKKKSNGIEKSKKKSSAEQAKNEGVDLNWAYAPPSGSQLVEKDEDADAGDFDWDKIKDDDDLELWLIRVPDSVKPKYLDGLKIDPPTSSNSARVGELKRKLVTYDIWSVGKDSDNLPIGGEEIKGLSCLLPRSSKKGKLYPSPKPFAHHLVFSAQAVTPTPTSDSNAGGSTQYKNPPRPTYPKEVLKHRFTPFGSVLKNLDDAEDVTMDVDPVEEPQPGQPRPSPKKKSRTKNHETTIADDAEPETEVRKTKGKKRKGEPGDPVDTPAKKTKKMKAA